MFSKGFGGAPDNVLPPALGDMEVGTAAGDAAGVGVLPDSVRGPSVVGWGDADDPVSFTACTLPFNERPVPANGDADGDDEEVASLGFADWPLMEGG